MALFGPADIGLPLTTQFYQIADLVWNDPEDLRGKELFTFIQTQWDYRSEKLGIVAKFHITDTALEDWALLHAPVASLMDALAAATERPEEPSIIDVDDLRHIQLEIKTAYGEHFHPYLKLPVERVPPQVKTPFIDWLVVDHHPAQQVDVRAVIIETPVRKSDFLKKLLLDEIVDLLAHRHPVHRCLECANPFVRKNKARTYCSFRCADRAGKRLRRLFVRGEV